MSDPAAKITGSLAERIAALKPVCSDPKEIDALEEEAEALEHEASDLRQRLGFHHGGEGRVCGECRFVGEGPSGRYRCSMCGCAHKSLGDLIRIAALGAKMPEITETIARKVLNLVDAGLVKGVGNPEPGKMCVEAAVCYAMGEPHGDKPSCVAPALRALKIRLNDSCWTDDMARAKGLRRLAVAQLGSRDALDENEFAKRCAKLAIKTVVPIALREAAKKQNNTKKRQPLIDCAEACETAAAAAAEAADAAAGQAASAASDADGDKILSDFAEGVVQILIKMNAPGCKWLALTEAA